MVWGKASISCAKYFFELSNNAKSLIQNSGTDLKAKNSIMRIPENLKTVLKFTERYLSTQVILIGIYSFTFSLLTYLPLPQWNLTYMT